MCGILLRIVAIAIGKQNYNKRRQILLPVPQQSQSHEKAGFSGHLDQEESY